MKAGEASTTAKYVAAHRLIFERTAASYGDPAADERLARDVASTTAVDLNGPMIPHLKGRTSFFDRVVVAMLDRGVRQVVITAAGYDGRALRYAKPGVRWFEVDHPDTQRDKRERLVRLGIETDHITFIAADFTVGDVAAKVRDAGHASGQPSLFLCEGLVVYLERTVLESLLGELRTVAPPGSRLAISVSASGGGAEQIARREDFRARVAAAGEPARTFLTADDADAVFADTGWRVAPSASSAEAQQRARRAGFVVVEPA